MARRRFPFSQRPDIYHQPLIIRMGHRRYRLNQRPPTCHLFQTFRHRSVHHKQHTEYQRNRMVLREFGPRPSSLAMVLNRLVDHRSRSVYRSTEGWADSRAWVVLTGWVAVWVAGWVAGMAACYRVNTILKLIRELKNKF